jgi:hypothetical protein
MQRVARIYGGILAIAGALYSGLAIYILFHVQEMAATLEFARAPERPEFGFVSIEAWSSGMRFNSWIFLSVGLPALICGIGIVSLREWARLLWLGVSAVITAAVIMWLYWHASMWKNAFELLMFAVPSFIFLRTRFARRTRAI